MFVHVCFCFAYLLVRLFSNGWATDIIFTKSPPLRILPLHLPWLTVWRPLASCHSFSFTLSSFSFYFKSGVYSFVSYTARWNWCNKVPLFSGALILVAPLACGL